MLELYHGRPVNEIGRLEKELRAYDLLNACHVDFQRVDHPPAPDMDTCERIEQSLQGMVCKNLFLCDRYGRDFYLLMLPGKKRFRTTELSGRLGPPVSPLPGKNQ